jgi:hypothetical protein
VENETNLIGNVGSIALLKFRLKIEFWKDLRKIIFGKNSCFSHFYLKIKLKEILRKQ